MQRKVIRMLGSTKTAQAEYTAGEAYSVVADVADRLVREKLAEYIDFGRDEPPKRKARSRSQKPWRETIQPGDSFEWQITLNLPLFEKPRIRPQFHPSEDFGLDAEESAGIEEVGGDGGSKPSEAQAKAIDYLAGQEPALYSKVLKALLDYAQEFRGDWENNNAELAGRILPCKTNAEDVADRISITRVCVTPKSKDGIAYIELDGECTWDPDHGFCVVLHGERIVDVSQQGYGWRDSSKG